MKKIVLICLGLAFGLSLTLSSKGGNKELLNPLNSLNLLNSTNPSFLPEEVQGGHPYLTFVTTDGAKASFNVSQLSFSIDGTTLKVGDRQFTLSNLSKMYFSTEDETTSGIEEVTKAVLDETTEIYDLKGRKVARDDKGELPKGVYIVKTKEGPHKLMVR